MMKEEIESVFTELMEKNIPFVLFRAPGKERKLLVQEKAIDFDKEIDLGERGFYVFPFSKKEKSKPIYLSPDHLIEGDSINHFKASFPTLKSNPIIPHDYYEVDEEEYISDLNIFLEAFEEQGIKKAIYSRIQEEELESEFKLWSFFKTLDVNYPKAFIYVLHIPGDGLWTGASPELLMSYSQGEAHTVALAGTLKIDHNKSAPDWTRKEIDEHRLVEKYIIALCDEMDIPFEKSKVRTSNTGKVYHLKSDFKLSIPVNQIKNFIEKLHPTPAISGLPQSKAIDLIYRTEKHDRSYYAGFLGFVEDKESFDLFINLRCMKIVQNSCFLYAGGGITPDSNIEKEWEETKIKMSTLTDLLNKDVHNEEISSVSC